ncbi:MAG: hypothetical protein GWN55_06055, partial [Phycisphaerae bacterium]|nr:hypothetical protein [candidate division KSB1 bacterium]NIV00879.1 hypothetical protein [Phycisphaerae bacterium]
MGRVIRETPAALTDVAVIRDIDAPASVVRGDTARFSVEVCCDAPPFTECEDVGVSIDGQIVTDTENVGAGDCSRFRFQKRIDTDTSVT